MIELVPPLAAAPGPATPARPPAIIRVKPTIRFPAFLARNQDAVEAIRRRWGETAMHALVAEYAPGANLDTHGLAVAEYGPLAWVDWVEWRRQPDPRVASWFNVHDTWQSLPTEVGLEVLMRAEGTRCLEEVTTTLDAVQEATGLQPLLPGSFGALVRSTPPLSPEALVVLASLIQSPRIVNRSIEFAGHYRGRVGPVRLDVEKARARLETRLELPPAAPAKA